MKIETLLSAYDRCWGELSEAMGCRDSWGQSIWSNKLHRIEKGIIRKFNRLEKKLAEAEQEIGDIYRGPFLKGEIMIEDIKKIATQVDLSEDFATALRKLCQEHNIEELSCEFKPMYGECSVLKYQKKNIVTRKETSKLEITLKRSI